MIRSRLTACVTRWGLVLAFASGSRALAAPGDAVREFADALPAGAVVVTAPGSGAIEALRGLSVPVGHGALAAEGAREWVLSAATAFGLDLADDDLVVGPVERLAAGRTRVTLRQTWRGIPVSGAAARAGAANSGRSSKPRGVARSSASSIASTTLARSITLAGRPASFATWMP